MIIDKAAHRNLTEHHITSTEGVYKYIPPTRTYRGEDRPNHYTYRNFVSSPNKVTY